MPKLINYGGELIRINEEKKRIETSKDNGVNWKPRYTSTSKGEFIDLLPYGNEILAVTSKGIYFSKDGGLNWNIRYTGTSKGEFYSLQDNGNELLAQTSKGLYYSKDKGINWTKRD